MTTAVDIDTPIGDNGFQALIRHLEEKGVDYEVVEHPPAHTAIGEGQRYGAPAHRIAKTVALKFEAGGDCLVVIPASERLDVHRVRQLLGAPSARLAHESEMLQSFPGLEPGALPPFGGVLPAPRLVDRRLLASSWVLANGGDHRHSVRVSPLEIVRLSRARVVDICEY